MVSGAKFVRARSCPLGGKDEDSGKSGVRVRELELGPAHGHAHGQTKQGLMCCLVSGAKL